MLTSTNKQRKEAPPSASNKRLSLTTGATPRAGSIGGAFPPGGGSGSGSSATTAGPASVPSTPRATLTSSSSSSSRSLLSRSRPGSRAGTLRLGDFKRADESKNALPTSGSGGSASGSSSSSSSSSASAPTTVATSSSSSYKPKPTTVTGLCDAFLESCRSHDSTDTEVKLGELRKAILFQGMPTDEHKTAKGASLRGKVWKVMLALDKVSSDEYIKLIERKESSKYPKIRGDTFRTFMGTEVFQKNVPETELIRVLNSFVLRYEPYFTYCQGMNAIAGPFLYCMPEVDAFFAFSKFITKKFPLYWLCSHIGVQAGAVLVDQCLKAVDKPLADHLEKHNLSAYIYAFHCISSLCASIPPFDELLKLWDFLIAFGPHLNILCVVAQVVMQRDRLLQSESPRGILDPRKWPHLRARAILSVALSLLPSIGAELYGRVSAHATDPAVASVVAARSLDNYIPLPKDEEEEPTEL